MRIALTFLILSGFLFGSKAYTQTEKFEALYIYNFTKYIDWPESKNGDDFIICVLGNSPIHQHLDQIAQQKKVGNQKIVVKKISNLSSDLTCNILFISYSKISSLEEAKNKLDRGTLIVTDRKGQTGKGASICFFEDNGLKFEISKNNIINSGLLVNSTLTSLGVEIN